jgi:hypothetical protein
MIFAPPFHRVVEHVDRRVLGAFQFVDAMTHLPVALAAEIEVREATLLGGGAPLPVARSENAIRIQQNRSAIYAILDAPFFDDYSASFADPADPFPPGRQLRLRMAATEVGPYYLPRGFTFDLPRTLDRTVAGNVFQSMAVELFRSPGAPVLGGWSVLRVRVEQEGTAAALPGVLVRVFASPRADHDLSIGWGLSEWRGDLAGEALVAVADLPRFRPATGPGENVFATTQPIELEAMRDPGFTGVESQLPDPTDLIAGTAPGIIRRRTDGPGPLLSAHPATPFDLRAGRETSVSLAMP